MTPLTYEKRGFAGGGARTHTTLRPLDFESSASANSATPASARFDTTKRATKLKFQSLRKTILFVPALSRIDIIANLPHPQKG